MGSYRTAWRWLYLVLALVFCSSVSAAITPTEQTLWKAGTFTGTQKYVCEMWAKDERPTEYHGVLQPDGNCHVLNENDRFIRSFFPVLYQTQQICPANSLLTGSTCSCNSGFTESGGSCVNASNAAKCTAAKGGSDWYSGFKSLPKVGTSYCPSDGEASSCGTTVDGGYCTVKNGVRSCAYEVKYTGATCTPPAATADEPKQDPCKGSVGTVNGKTVCVPIGSDPKVTVETGKTSTETTTKPGENGGPATTTTTTTDKNTTCTGNQCTTTTTTTTSGGSGGAASTTTSDKAEPKEDYCKDNPQAALCKNSTFGGSCSAQFTCDGDAIMCAIAKDQLQRNCQALDPDTDSGSVTNKALSGEDKLNTEEMKATAKAAPVQVGSFNTSGRGWGRSCPADPVIAIPWAKGNATQWSIPFSRLCGPLGLLANAAVAVTLLGALAWVVGGSKAAA
jgi:hypothetical protein